MTIKIPTLIFLLCAILHTHLVSTGFGYNKPKAVFTQILPTILFTKVGSIIPQISWATIRIQINTTGLFEETGQICKVAKTLDKKLGSYYKNKMNIYTNFNKKQLTIDKRQFDTKNGRVMVQMINNLFKSCKENTYK